MSAENFSVEQLNASLRRRTRYDWHKRDIKRDNFATFYELVDACDEARKILRRKRATIDEVRRAADLFNMAVRTLRSWHSSRCDTIRELLKKRSHLTSKDGKTAYLVEL